jgi:hypothetical protein
VERIEIDKLDEYWAEIVKWKARWKCEHCGIQGVRMEAAHVVGRRHRATRWGYWALNIQTGVEVYEISGHCFCHGCHQNYDEHGPLEAKIVSLTIGRDRKENIQRYAKQTVAKYQDFDEIKATLQAFVWFNASEDHDGSELTVFKSWKKRGKKRAKK